MAVYIDMIAMLLLPLQPWERVMYVSLSLSLSLCVCVCVYVCVWICVICARVRV